MISESVIIRDPMGFHAQLVSEFCAQANRFACNIKVRYQGRSYSGRDIFLLMSLKAKQNEEIQIICNGRDEKEALEALKNVFGKK